MGREVTTRKVAEGGKVDEGREGRRGKEGGEGNGR